MSSLQPILDHAITVRDLLWVAGYALMALGGIAITGALMAAVYYLWPHEKH